MAGFVVGEQPEQTSFGSDEHTLPRVASQTGGRVLTSAAEAFRDDVTTALQGLAQERMTMVVVTHEMGFARQVADRVIFMDAGAFIEEAPPEPFFSTPREERTRRFLSRLLR